MDKWCARSKHVGCCAVKGSERKHLLCLAILLPVVAVADAVSHSTSPKLFLLLREHVNKLNHASSTATSLMSSGVNASALSRLFCEVSNDRYIDKNKKLVQSPLFEEKDNHGEQPDRPQHLRLYPGSSQDPQNHYVRSILRIDFLDFNV